MPANAIAFPARVRCTPPGLIALVLVILWPDGYAASTPARMTWGPLAPPEETAAISPAAATPLVTLAKTDGPAVEEMLRGPKGRVEQWSAVPELVVLTSVMQFQPGRSTEYVATSEVLTADDVDDLATELTSALGLLTGHTFDCFAAVRRESVAPGAPTRVIRTNQIVVARYRGLQDQAGVLGLGGRMARPDGTITGAAIVLDEEYDRTGPMRTRLRTHELGHALGYHHVESRESIMNPRIGPTLTELDRRIATIAYLRR